MRNVDSLFTSNGDMWRKSQDEWILTVSLFFFCLTWLLFWRMFIKCFIAFLLPPPRGFPSKHKSTKHNCFYDLRVYRESFAVQALSPLLCFIVFSSAHENQIMMSQKDLQTLRLSPRAEQDKLRRRQRFS